MFVYVSDMVRGFPGSHLNQSPTNLGIWCIWGPSIRLKSNQRVLVWSYCIRSAIIIACNAKYQWNQNLPIKIWTKVRDLLSILIQTSSLHRLLIFSNNHLYSFKPRMCIYEHFNMVVYLLAVWKWLIEVFDRYCQDFSLEVDVMSSILNVGIVSATQVRKVKQLNTRQLA